MAPTAERDPFAVAALVGAGTLVGHEVGYLADASAGNGHEYFALIAPLAIVGVVIAVWASAVSVLRRGTARAPGVASLALAQSVLYVGFEVGERTIGTTDSPILSLPVLLGLLAQPLVAWLAVSALRLSAAVVAAAVGSAPPSLAARTGALVSSTTSPPTVLLGTSAPARAPPLFF